MTARRASHGRIIAAILRKDAREFTRDRLYVYLSALGLVAYVAIYWVLPSRVMETFAVGVTPPEIAEAVGAGGLREAEGVRLVPFADEGALAAAVREGGSGGEDRVGIGVALAPGFLADVRAGRGSSVRLFVAAAVPPEFRELVVSGMREIGHLLAGNPLPVTVSPDGVTVLGDDRLGRQVPLRDRMRPLFAFLILLVESFALASLVASEIHARTAVALRVTPATIGDLLAAKAIFGTLLAFSQAVVLVLAVDGLGDQPTVPLVALLLGAVLVTAIGLIAGSAGRDFLGTLSWSVVFLVPLALPAFGVLFPGSASWWIRALPTYGIIDALVGAAWGDGWAQAGPSLAAAAAWTAGLLGVALLVLRRKVRAL